MQPNTRPWQHVLDFWFLPEDHAEHGDDRPEWFRKDAAFDATIRERFGHAFDAALRGELSDWRGDLHAALAHVVLLDQFTRNAFRDTPRAFAGDGEALVTAVGVVDASLDRALDIHERRFLYMPF